MSVGERWPWRCHLAEMASNDQWMATFSLFLGSIATFTTGQTGQETRDQHRNYHFLLSAIILLLPVHRPWNVQTAVCTRQFFRSKNTLRLVQLDPPPNVNENCKVEWNVARCGDRRRMEMHRLFKLWPSLKRSSHILLFKWPFFLSEGRKITRSAGKQSQTS